MQIIMIERVKEAIELPLVTKVIKLNKQTQFWSDCRDYEPGQGPEICKIVIPNLTFFNSLIWLGQKTILFTVPLQGPIKFLVPCPNLIIGDLDHFCIPEGILLLYFTVSC